jgi:hypothetical protein
MKKTLITIILIGIISSINGMEFCGIKKGLYLDVKTSVYELYRPIETLTNNYIQIDSNKDYKLFKPMHVLANEQLTSACGVKSVYCD